MARFHLKLVEDQLQQKSQNNSQLISQLQQKSQHISQLQQKLNSAEEQLKSYKDKFGALNTTVPHNQPLLPPSTPFPRPRPKPSLGGAKPKVESTPKS